MKAYTPEINGEMKKFYQTLSEKDRRRYAAVEALKLGHGGIKYVAQVLGCDRNTVREGMRELKALPENSGYEPRLRKAGGGRKPYHHTHPQIDTQFLEVVADHTAGDPMKADIRWTNLSPQALANRLADRHGVRVSKRVIQHLLAKHGYRRRQAQKNRP